MVSPAKRWGPWQPWKERLQHIYGQTIEEHWDIVLGQIEERIPEFARKRPWFYEWDFVRIEPPPEFAAEFRPIHAGWDIEIADYAEPDFDRIVSEAVDRIKWELPEDVPAIEKRVRKTLSPVRRAIYRAWKRARELVKQFLKDEVEARRMAEQALYLALAGEPRKADELMRNVLALEEIATGGVKQWHRFAKAIAEMLPEYEELPEPLP